MIYDNILQTIGNTPVISLNRLVKKHKIDGKIYAKIEFYSPGLSKKDRIAKYIIEKAQQSGLLKKGQTVIEQTSGNTGIGLAAVCAITGNPFIAVMSEGNSFERIAMIRNFGAKVVLVKQSKNSVKGSVSREDMDLVELEFNRLADETGAFKVGQFYNEDNAWAHFYGTAQEIIKDLPGLDAFCDFVGTGGSFEGIAAALKQHNDKTECFVVEPAHLKHIIQGGGYFKKVPFENVQNCNAKISIGDDEVIFWMKELAQCEAIAGGISTGANLAAAVKYLKLNPGKSVLFLVNDPSLKYLSVASIQEELFS